jgi:hypothetical protein
MEARRYAADVPAGVTGAAGGCSPHERRDMREQSRVSLRSCAPRLLCLCATGCLARGSTRRPTRAQPLHGANRHGGNHLQRHGSRPSHQPFDEIECQLGPKIPHDPASLSQGHRRAALGKKRKWKSPVRRRRGPRKNPCTRLSAHAKYPWFTRSRWTEECRAATSEWPCD